MQEFTVARDEVGAHNISMVADEIVVVRFALKVRMVEIISDGYAELFYSLDGTEPTMHGSHCYRMIEGGYVVDVRRRNSLAPLVVSLVSAGTPIISVQRGDY